MSYQDSQIKIKGRTSTQTIRMVQLAMGYMLLPITQLLYKDKHTQLQHCAGKCILCPFRNLLTHNCQATDIEAGSCKVATVATNYHNKNREIIVPRFQVMVIFLFVFTALNILEGLIITAFCQQFCLVANDVSKAS